MSPQVFFLSYIFTLNGVELSKRKNQAKQTSSTNAKIHPPTVLSAAKMAVDETKGKRFRLFRMRKHIIYLTRRALWISVIFTIQYIGIQTKKKTQLFDEFFYLVFFYVFEWSVSTHIHADWFSWKILRFGILILK